MSTVHVAHSTHRLNVASMSIKQKISDHFPILIDYVVRIFEIIVHLWQMLCHAFCSLSASTRARGNYKESLHLFSMFLLFILSELCFTVFAGIVCGANASTSGREREREKMKSSKFDWIAIDINWCSNMYFEHGFSEAWSTSHVSTDSCSTDLIDFLYNWN